MKCILNIPNINKIIVIGNAAGGKTELSRRLSKVYNLPLTHVDSIQFLPGLKMRAVQESVRMIDEVSRQERWLIDGFGPLDLIEKRFSIADIIIFIDFPLWRHYWWLLKRQVKNIWSIRQELPENCNELSLQHTIKIINNIWKVHTQMRPELLRILDRDNLKFKVIRIHNLEQWNFVAKYQY